MPLNTDQLTEIRQFVQRSSDPCDRPKGVINAAVNALDTYFETTAKAGFVAAVETAVPAQFTLPQKIQLAKNWLRVKAGVL